MLQGALSGDKHRSDAASSHQQRELRRLLAQTLVAAGRASDAIAEYEENLKMGTPDAPSLREVAELYIAAAKNTLALDRLRRAIGNLPHELPDQMELRRLAAPYFNSRLDGGEGDMLVGKALWAYHRKKAHMICELSPYACMPNTMSVGAMAAVLGRYPDLLYAPLEIKGDAEVHALSRCQMVLTEARKRARQEFDDALAATGLTVAAVRAHLDAHPEMKRATYRVGHHGAAGTAANLVLHVAERTGARRAAPGS